MPLRFLAHIVGQHAMVVEAVVVVVLGAGAGFLEVFWVGGGGVGAGEPGGAGVEDGGEGGEEGGRCDGREGCGEDEELDGELHG